MTTLTIVPGNGTRYYRPWDGAYACYRKVGNELRPAGIVEDVADAQRWVSGHVVRFVQ